jgi:chaperone required for assembly of F1-ATPase
LGEDQDPYSQGAWRLELMRPKPKAFSERQREFWNQLRDWVHQNEGWIVSEPHTPLIRFECRAESELPQLLRAKGYDLNSAGTNERLMPVTELVREHGCIRRVARDHIAPQMVSVFEFKLPF